MVGRYFSKIFIIFQGNIIYNKNYRNLIPKKFSDINLILKKFSDINLISILKVLVYSSNKL